jgi:hypothetical protein
MQRVTRAEVRILGTSNDLRTAAGNSGILAWEEQNISLLCIHSRKGS